MARKKTKLESIKNIKHKYFLMCLVVVFAITILFSVIKLFEIFQLRKQLGIILDYCSITNHLQSSEDVSKPEGSVATDTPVITNYTPTTTPPDINQGYSNVTAEPFFNPLLIDAAKTNMQLDDVVTAVTFLPVYTFKKQKNCSDSFCGISVNKTGDLREQDGQLYYKDNLIDLPGELKDKQISNFTFSLLDKKWVMGVVTVENGREVGYVYLFDGKNMEALITSNSEHQIKTQYDFKGGSISAGGSDSQFIILYSGYEGIGYLYNKGNWQDVSQYFGLRVTKGGFKARILRGGSGNTANWYVCSDTTDKPKLIKLWQNNSANIQGSVDLSKILDSGTAICSLKGNRELNIARNFAGEDSLFSFVDKGFNNSHAYHYQSLNLSDFTDKKIVSVELKEYVINAPANLYSLAVSNDGIKWQSSSDNNYKFEGSTSTAFYVKADFKTRDAEYSPWFNGINLISYMAKNIN
jgi:hypothetical protein